MAKILNSFFTLLPSPR